MLMPYKPIVLKPNYWRCFCSDFVGYLIAQVLFIFFVGLNSKDSNVMASFVFLPFLGFTAMWAAQRIFQWGRLELNETCIVVNQFWGKQVHPWDSIGNFYEGSSSIGSHEGGGYSIQICVELPNIDMGRALTGYLYADYDRKHFAEYLNNYKAQIKA
jgi:hypothetical protein